MKHLNFRRRKHMAALENREKHAAWLTGVMEAQRAYDWHLRDEEGAQAVGMVHPDAWRRWIELGPCADCPCGSWCDRICRLRAKWWDDHMVRIRRQCR